MKIIQGLKTEREGLVVRFRKSQLEVHVHFREGRVEGRRVDFDQGPVLQRSERAVAFLSAEISQREHSKPRSFPPPRVGTFFAKRKVEFHGSFHRMTFRLNKGLFLF